MYKKLSIIGLLLLTLGLSGCQLDIDKYIGTYRTHGAANSVTGTSDVDRMMRDSLNHIDPAYTLELRKDRTFTLNGGTPVEGTWRKFGAVINFRVTSNTGSVGSLGQSRGGAFSLIVKFKDGKPYLTTGAESFQSLTFYKDES